MNRKYKGCKRISNEFLGCCAAAQWVTLKPHDSRMSGIILKRFPGSVTEVTLLFLFITYLLFSNCRFLMDSDQVSRAHAFAPSVSRSLLQMYS